MGFCTFGTSPSCSSEGGGKDEYRDVLCRPGQRISVTGSDPQGQAGCQSSFGRRDWLNGLNSGRFKRLFEWLAMKETGWRGSDR